MDMYPPHATIADIQYNVTQVLRNVLGLDNVFPTLYTSQHKLYFQVVLTPSYSHTGQQMLASFIDKVLSKPFNASTEYSILMVPNPTLHDVINMLAFGRLLSVNDL